MGCNCRKSGAGKRAFTGQAGAPGTRTATATSGNPTSSEFSLTFSDGRKMTFGSRLEADAENARNRYAGVVRRV